MVWEDYEAARRALKAALKNYEAVIAEQEELFRRTQPQAVRPDKERVSGGKNRDVFADYLAKKDHRKIDTRLKEAREICDARLDILHRIETALKASNDPADRVYRLRYLDRLRVRKIARLVNYSEAQVFRILKAIRDFRNDERK